MIISNNNSHPLQISRYSFVNTPQFNENGTSKFIPTIRVYPNGDMTYNGVEPQDILTHIWYNRTMRFGCDLFVDGKLAVKSSVYKDTPERIERLKRLEEQFIKENWIPSRNTAPYR